MFFFFSCEEKLNVWKDMESRIHFGEIDKNDVLNKSIEYSFVYLAPNIKKDTIYVRINASGFSANHDRRIKIEQEKIDTVDNAVAGIHYVDFNSEEIQMLHIMPKDSVSALIPIVVLRDESAIDKKFTLKIQIKNNENFSLGVQTKLERIITISDYLTKPSLWNADYEKKYFGTYSQVKHRFMIVTSGKNFDNDYFKDEIGNDTDLKEYFRDFFRKKLAEYNSNPANSDIPLKSEPIDGFPDGQYISFPQ